jgi:predicted ATP-dependent protease
MTHKMMKIKPLPTKLLCTKCNPKHLNFTTTAELADLLEPVGQERALAAIDFGIHIQKNGYNLYLLGPEGSGKHHLIDSILTEQARSQTTPNDWCYVNNFSDPLKPIALCLPAGMGIVLQKDMADFLQSPSSLPSLEKKYETLPEVRAYLAAVKADLGDQTVIEAASSMQYRVNLLVSHAPDSGAPIIYEHHPTHASLVGRIEYLSQHGTFTPHFSLIRPGALHRANGGYLILEAQQLVNQPNAWEALKRALLSQQIVIEPSSQEVGFPQAVSLEPQTIPLHVKVILLGERPLYYTLGENDQNFYDLFKVAADFTNHIPRTADNYEVFSRLLATLCQAEQLLPLDRRAVARMIDHSSRLACDSQRLFTHRRWLVDLLREAHYWAQQNRHSLIKVQDVEYAIDQQIYRVNRIETRVHEDYRRNILLVSTKGKKIGQVNGLSVLQIGHYSFGAPNRITATVRLGKGEVIDIEREVELGGALHSKGVFILSGYLGGRYLVDHHLSISASLVFEQNYGEVEGDSASAAELAALLSAIARVPISQGLAITGSVNQYGQVQAIGNVNEKIEGFFSVCHLKGLTGQQGVIIPSANVQHLMLRDEVIVAAKKKRFFVYAVETIDEVMTILTGLSAKKLNEMIEKNLLRFAEQADGNHK